MTSKRDSVSTLGYHWTDRTGRPLEPQVHWDATGTTLDDASTQWCSSGDPVLICIIGTHWKTTGKPLEDHWKTTGSTLAFLQWHSSVHWGLSSRHTGLPLEDHWLRVRDHDTRESEGNMFNPIFKVIVQGQKHPGRCVVAEPKRPSLKSPISLGQNEYPWA